MRLAILVSLTMLGCGGFDPLAVSPDSEMSEDEAWATLPTPEFVERAKVVYAQSEARCPEESTPERAAKTVRAVWSTPDERMAAIVCYRIWVGMTRSQLIASLGDPNTVNRSVSGSGQREQWVYRSYYGYSATYVYVQDGRVTSFQTSGGR